MIARIVASAILALLLAGCDRPASYESWEVYAGSKQNIRYSSLTQLDTSNISKLQVAWTYHTGDADTANYSQIQCNPIVVDGIMYGTTPRLKLFAVDAATGKQKWVFDPYDPSKKMDASHFGMNNVRGVTYWTDGKQTKRIFYSAGSNLFSIDAENGQPDTSFGHKGSIDLHNELGRDVSTLFVTSSSPGIVYKDLIIIGTRVDEGPNAAPGHIRAYNVRTGKLAWIFHTIPQPGEPGYETWEDPEAWKHIGGANVWSGFSMDEEKGILFASTGSASFDFYGGMRKGANLYGNCMLAIEAGTGKLIWHFQQVHHDVWDRDFPTPPALVTLKRNGQTIEAVAQPTKSGYVFVLERTTGKPLFEIRETPVNTDSDLEGEKLWATQPIPVLPKPFVRQSFTEKDINPLLPDTARNAIAARLAGYRTGNLFLPPSRQGTIILPGFDGGAEWGGPSVDPESGIMYINANEMAWVLKMIDLGAGGPVKETVAEAGKRLYMNNCLSCHGANRQGSGNYPSLRNISQRYSDAAVDSLLQAGRRMMPAFRQLTPEERRAITAFVRDDRPAFSKPFVKAAGANDKYLKLPYTNDGYRKFLTDDGLPAIGPPWGTLNAIDLNSGNILWQVPLGSDPAFPQAKTPTGTENYGGPVVTAGGLVFIAATKDSKFRVFNKRSGALLLEKELPASGFATPAVYSLKGKQYVVIACGGGKLRARSGDAYVAFALP